MNPIIDGVAFVTGAASGIGLGAVHGLASHGIRQIAMGDTNEAGLKAAAAELESAHPGVETLCLALDVTSEASVRAAVQATAGRFGRIDVAVNNAGVGGPGGPAPQVEYAAWRAAVDVNLHGVWLCQRAQIAQMLGQESRGERRGRGVIVNMASMFGVTGASMKGPFTAYGASKHAVVGLTRTEAIALAQDGIRINALCPGYVETPLLKSAADAGRLDEEIAKVPMKRMARVEEIVDCIVFLASPMSSFMTGAAMVVDGGFTAQ